MLNGGCLCGLVRYEITGEPIFAGLCHCRDCQRSSGSAFAPYLGIRAADFRLSGEVRRYAKPNDSGGQSQRHFCPNCGSTVFGRGNGWVTVYAGTLDEPDRFMPREHIFVRSRCSWAHLPPESLPQYQTLPPQAAS